MITAAGVVLAATFAALTQIPQVSIAEVGTAVALGVLLDTLVVRTVLVPASLLTIGERVWVAGPQPRGRKRRRRRLFVTTKTELNAIAAAAIMGLSSPDAARGMAAML